MGKEFSFHLLPFSPPQSLPLNGLTKCVDIWAIAGVVFERRVDEVSLASLIIFLNTPNNSSRYLS